jgi:hypothetical protein
MRLLFALFVLLIIGLQAQACEMEKMLSMVGSTTSFEIGEIGSDHGTYNPPVFNVVESCNKVDNGQPALLIEIIKEQDGQYAISGKTWDFEGRLWPKWTKNVTLPWSLEIRTRYWPITMEGFASPAGCDVTAGLSGRDNLINIEEVSNDTLRVSYEV